MNGEIIAATPVAAYAVPRKFEAASPNTTTSVHTILPYEELENIKIQKTDGK